MIIDPFTLCDDVDCMDVFCNIDILNNMKNIGIIDERQLEILLLRFGHVERSFKSYREIGKRIFWKRSPTRTLSGNRVMELIIKSHRKIHNHIKETKYEK